MNTYDPKNTPRRRAIFVMDSDDYRTIEDFANQKNYTTSAVLREAAHRMAESIRRNKET